MASIYTKAPQFVDNSQSNLAVIDSYDKEMQRINQDYAIAGKTARDFRSKVDILKANEKAYFDETYNKSVEQFSSKIDLTKRGQINQVETVLTDIIKDPIINTAVKSTQYVNKVLAMRNELKTNPKYIKHHREADEFAEQQVINQYLSSDKLGESFALTGPIITMDSDKLVADTVKSIQYEESSTNFGPVNLHEKYKSVGKTTGAVYQALSGNPEALAAERNNFNYLYRTPEAKKQLGQQLAASKKEHLASIASRLTDIDAKILLNKENGLALVQLNREAQNLKQEQSTLYAINPEDENSIFNSYLLRKSLDAGKTNQETKQVKVEADQYTKYFTEKGYKDRDFQLAVAKFQETQKQNEFNNQYKTNLLGLKSAELGIDSQGNPTSTPDDVFAQDTTVVFNPEVDIHKEITSQKASLINQNSTDGKRIVSLLKDSPETTQGKKYKEYVKKGLIVDHSTSGLFSPREFQNLLSLKNAIVIGSGTPMTKEMQEIDQLLSNIAERNEEYRLTENMEKLAAKKAGVKNGNTFDDMGFKTDIGKNYDAQLKAMLQAQNAYKEVFITNKNKDQDRKGNYNTNFRAAIQRQVELEGLLNSTGIKYGVPGTVGPKTGLFGNRSLSKEQMDRIDWDNSIVSITPGKNTHVVKLKLNSKEKDKPLTIEGFENGYAFVEVNNEMANKIMSSMGVSLQSFRETADIYTRLNASGLSTKDKNKILGNDLLSIKTLPLGNTKASYQVEARDGNEYYINMNVAGTTITTRTGRPRELLKAIEIAGAELYPFMKSQPNFSQQAFNQELIKVANGLIRTNKY